MRRRQDGAPGIPAHQAPVPHPQRTSRTGLVPVSCNDSVSLQLPPAPGNPRPRACAPNAATNVMTNAALVEQSRHLTYRASMSLPAGRDAPSLPSARSALRARTELGVWLPRVSPIPILLIVALVDTIAAYERALEPKKLVTIPGRAFRCLSRSNPAIEQRDDRVVQRTSRLRRWASGRMPADGEPAGTRTQDPVIKSHVLYRLSYGLAWPVC